MNDKNDKEPFLLKNLYHPQLLGQMADEFALVRPDFGKAGFLKAVFDDTWQDLALKQRMRHISRCLGRFLPAPYSVAAAVVVEVARQKIGRSGDQLSFEWMILPDFIEAFGVEDPDVSIPALEEITRLSSAEFAVRPFLLRYPDRMYAQMFQWSKHASPMVRRLSSEGIRPRLPWGLGVPALKKDPSPIWPILDELKADPAETVRRSVANNLNDISKDHPDAALDWARKAFGLTPETDWVVKHGCRGLLKKGTPQALALFGFERGAEGIEVSDFAWDGQVPVGGLFHFRFKTKNASALPQKIRLEYAIHYLTGTGKISRKVFQISQANFAAGATEQYHCRQRFTDFTTRKHYPGRHRLEILVNGEPAAEGEFIVV